MRRGALLSLCAIWKKHHTFFWCSAKRGIGEILSYRLSKRNIPGTGGVAFVILPEKNRRARRIYLIFLSGKDALNYTIFPLSRVMTSSANFKIFLSCSIIRMVSHLSKNSLMTLISFTISSAWRPTVGSSKKYIVCPLYDFNRCFTSFNLWLSPHESVCAGCPILRYPSPISTMSWSSSRMWSISEKNSRASFTYIPNTSSMLFPLRLIQRISVLYLFPLHNSQGI